MRKFLFSLVAGSAFVVGLTAIPAVAQQDSSTLAHKQAVAAQTQNFEIVGKADGSVVAKVNGVPMAADTVTAHTPWTGKRFNSQYVCAQNNIGTAWNLSAATSAFESGLNSYVINYRFPAYGDQPCNVSYSASQIILYGTYNSANGTCYSVNASSVNGRYTSYVSIGFNLNSSVQSICRGDAQRRNNVASQSTGNALGLANFSSSSSYTASIMNDYFDDVYSFAGADDRTSICQMLGICG